VLLVPYTTPSLTWNDYTSNHSSCNDSEAGIQLATGSWDCSVRVWNLATPATSQRQFIGAWVSVYIMYTRMYMRTLKNKISQNTIPAHVAPVTALAWHPTSTAPAALLASASRVRHYTCICVWHIYKYYIYIFIHEETHTYTQHTHKPHHTTHNKNKTQQDKSVKAWDLRAKNIGDCARLLDGMPHAVLSLAWLPQANQQVLALGEFKYIYTIANILLTWYAFLSFAYRLTLFNASTTRRAGGRRRRARRHPPAGGAAVGAGARM
jgi:WD40 repeat protein